MRIVAGTYRSRVIQAVDGTSTRPTTDKIKEAIFSRIGPYFNDGVMLDLFGGSGNMGLEAISRGIQHVVFVDNEYKAIQTIKKNTASLDVSSQCTIWKMDYHKALAQCVANKLSFDLIFLDPPYKKQQISNILDYIDKHELLNKGGNIICESLKEDNFDNDYTYFEQVKDTTYGITRITYYRRK